MSLRRLFQVSGGNRTRLLPNELAVQRDKFAATLVRDRSRHDGRTCSYLESRQRGRLRDEDVETALPDTPKK